ncbi:hypothetical protein Pmani_000869 [Petrolisthes manimaculis]|uniref:Uncharacterized protein n=1 Tax=Petrolisthes manimaculis TaxID=1843537 RepID=A0AAE1UPX5_9EUCA|nr:hypothetical protein Pmani_000869 [Petrolisthes manimaculis]
MIVGLEKVDDTHLSLAAACLFVRPPHQPTSQSYLTLIYPSSQYSSLYHNTPLFITITSAHSPFSLLHSHHNSLFITINSAHSLSHSSHSSLSQTPPLLPTPPTPPP